MEEKEYTELMNCGTSELSYVWLKSRRKWEAVKIFEEIMAELDKTINPQIKDTEWPQAKKKESHLKANDN